jgi:hypothetical protein
LLAPLRYLAISHPEKAAYDRLYPALLALAGWVFYWLVTPKPKLFGQGGLLDLTWDLLVMAVPFMVGALAAVAMGSPGGHLDRRPRGVELFLHGKSLTLRQFVCYLLGYLSFLGLVTLGGVAAADLLHDTVIAWAAPAQSARTVIMLCGTLVLSGLLSALIVTVFWSLYFLTDVVNDVE